MTNNTAVVIVYADSPGRPMAQKIGSHRWPQLTRIVRQDQVPFHVRSYQEILRLEQEIIRQGSGGANRLVEIRRVGEQKKFDEC